MKLIKDCKKETLVQLGRDVFGLWLLYAMLVSIPFLTTGCSFKVETLYHGRTGLRNVDYSPNVESGDEQYVKRVGRKY